MKKIHIFALFKGRYIKKKKEKNILFHVRGHGSFPGLIFHIQDVEDEPPVLKEIPPLIYTNISNLNKLLHWNFAIFELFITKIDILNKSYPTFVYIGFKGLCGIHVLNLLIIKLASIKSIYIENKNFFIRFYVNFKIINSSSKFWMKYFRFLLSLLTIS